MPVISVNLTVSGEEDSMTLERQQTNEEMRHVPPVDWIATKLDYDLRELINRIWESLQDLDELPADVDRSMKTLCKWLHHLTVLAGGKRTDFGGHILAKDVACISPRAE